MIRKNTNISQDYLKERFNYCSETGIFTVKRAVSGSRRIGQAAGWIDKRCKGYIRIEISGTVYYAHRLAWLYVYGCFPDDEIDHINGIRGDNRISNLRLVSRRNNMMNKGRYKNNSSGITGVYWYKSTEKWLAKIRFNDKMIHLGYFEDFFEACCARRSAEIKYGFHKNHGLPR